MKRFASLKRKAWRDGDYANWIAIVEHDSKGRVLRTVANLPAYTTISVTSREKQIERAERDAQAMVDGLNAAHEASQKDNAPSGNSGR